MDDRTRAARFDPGMSINAAAVSATAAVGTLLLTAALSFEGITRRARAYRDLDRLTHIRSRIPDALSLVQGVVEDEMVYTAAELDPRNPELLGSLPPRPIVRWWRVLLGVYMIAFGIIEDGVFS